MSTLRRLWRGGAGRFGILVVSIIVVTAVVSAVTTFAGGALADDLCLVAVRPRPGHRPEPAEGGEAGALRQPAGVSIPAPTVALVASSTRMNRPVTRLRE